VVVAAILLAGAGVSVLCYFAVVWGGAVLGFLGSFKF
jgi:hypothetical protein